MTHPDMRKKKQVTARMTDQFAKDLNLIMACTRQDSATAVVQDAVHQLAEYYRVAMQRKWLSNARQEGPSLSIGEATDWGYNDDTA